jgi:hypothetical protein
MNASTPFTVRVVEPKHNVKISIIDIPEIDPQLKLLLDEKLISICEGCSPSELTLVKSRVLRFMAPKDANTKMGATAELFMHLYLSTLGFKQECLFLNLEENSIKKGFDGYYSKENEEWIMESKSGAIETIGISHRSKIKESYEDLKSKLAGGANNNPWRNAYNHASHADVGTHPSIKSQIRKLADSYEAKSFCDIKDFNIIPGSTIFLSDTWKDNDTDMVDKLTNLLATLEFKKIVAICITKRSLNLFIEYLGE